MSRHLIASLPLLLILLLTPFAAPSAPLRQDQFPPTDMSVSITWNAYHKVAVGTAIVVAGLGLALAAAFFFPLAAYKICYMLGGCQNTMDYFVDRLVADEGEAAEGKVKRSADYFEPVLMTLAKAYRKYGGLGEGGVQGEGVSRG